MVQNAGSFYKDFFKTGNSYYHSQAQLLIQMIQNYNETNVYPLKIRM